MKIPVLCLVIAAVCIGLSLDSCTKTVVETKIVTDTLRDTTQGMALVRFVSLFPDTIAGPLYLSATPDRNSSLFTTVSTSCGNQYIPIRPDTSLKCYVTNSSNTGFLDSVTIPPLGQTLNTYALFFNSGLRYRRTIDSAKLTPPPPGYAYVRLINGNQSIGDSQLDTSATIEGSLFISPVGFSEASAYVLVKAGRPYTVILREQDNSEVLNTTPQTFTDGAYYTAQATGYLDSNGMTHFHLAINEE